MYKKIWSVEFSKQKGIPDLPSSRYFSKYTEEGRNLISKYFSNSFNNFEDNILEGYIKKTAENDFTNRLAFYREKKKISMDNIYIDTGSKLANLILNKEKKKKSFFILNFILNFLISHVFLIIFFIKSLIICVYTKKIKKSGEIIFLRKKDYPDAGMKDILFSQIKNISCSSMITFFSLKKSKYNFNYINEYEKSTVICINAYFISFKDIFHFCKVFTHNHLPISNLLQAIKDSFISHNIKLFKSKLITGVLLDKPLYVLVFRNKLNYQKLFSLNESFLYPPFRSFDYNFLDKYYSMNEIDEGMINKYGGNIKQFSRVGFYRKNLNSISKGISKDLNKKIKEYKNIIVACPVQIGVDEFFWFDKNDLDVFLNSVLNVSKEMSDTLIIIKGKKNELTYTNKDLLGHLKNQENIYIINSDKPKLLKYNHFEDLIKICTLMLSINSGSTTVWQSFSNYKPVVILNNYHEKCFLSKFKNIEVNEEQLTEAISYWIEMDQNSRNRLINEIVSFTNMGSFNGLEEIAKDIKLFLSNKN